MKTTTSELTFKDLFGHIKARFDIGRHDFQVAPGLYQLGSPTPDSPVLVTCNYKMTFDQVRHSLIDHHLWILVLDTKGVNVWCAAGKGTFGTEELLKKIEEEKLSDVVTHKKLILPQLGASGVCAHEVHKRSGFHVIYGPVYVKDLPVFLKTKIKTEKMRKISFTFKDRLILTPVEIMGGKKTFISVFFLTSATYYLIKKDFDGISPHLLVWIMAYLSGSFLFPLCLPLFPWKNFTLGGCLLGALTASGLSYLFHFPWELTVLWTLLASALAGYQALNFTGATTFTCPSGVKREMKWALPFLGSLAGLGLVFGLYELVRATWF